nr:uncharacterized protein LOC105089057 [Camelus dromedarius]
MHLSRPLLQEKESPSLNQSDESLRSPDSRHAFSLADSAAVWPPARCSPQMWKDREGASRTGEPAHSDRTAAHAACGDSQSLEALPQSWIRISLRLTVRAVPGARAVPAAEARSGGLDSTDVNVPPDLSICTFVLEQSLSVRDLQEMLANTVEKSEGKVDVEKWKFMMKVGEDNSCYQSDPKYNEFFNKKQHARCVELAAGDGPVE